MIQEELSVQTGKLWFDFLIFMQLCLITMDPAPDFEGDSSKFRSGCIQSGQINVFGMHVSGGRVCACLRESLF